MKCGKFVDGGERLAGSVEQARSNRSLLPVSLCYVARGDI